MWCYEQNTGHLISPEHELLGTGYAGGNVWPHYDADAVNNPARQREKNVGPLPRGRYTIGVAHDEPTLGPLAMYLQPDPTNEMFGRSGFFIHADSIAHPGEASEGCIVMPHSIRAMVAASNDRALWVLVADQYAAQLNVGAGPVTPAPLAHAIVATSLAA